ncbi:MAG: hypothetical protein MUC76_11650 [Spirochaetes bacterium]|jgi:transcriptional regulator with PAS, ATPase and Fis domain|nr:hypothetical protein [Spirochaetota bacterium]
MAGKREEGKGDLREFRENPYDPEAKKPEDVVRIFYINNVPLVPVVSHRGILLGILKKDDVVAELSDIERASKRSIDAFITGLARKMPLDEVLPYVAEMREFVTINLFGEMQGTWSRLQLLAACESPRGAESIAADASEDREKQAMEWMIYLILEHIPRALYALNERGGTIFYNSHFEDLYEAALKREVDTAFVEKSLGNSDKNEVHTRADGSNEPYFYNRDMRIYYEKVPFQSGGKNVGYLIYCGRELNAPSAGGKASRGGKKQSLAQTLESAERTAIVNAIIAHGGDAKKAAEDLGLSRATLSARMKKLGIVDKGRTGRRPKK